MVLWISLIIFIFSGFVFLCVKLFSQISFQILRNKSLPHEFPRTKNRLSSNFGEFVNEGARNKVFLTKDQIILKPKRTVPLRIAPPPPKKVLLGHSEPTTADSASLYLKISSPSSVEQSTMKEIIERFNRKLNL